MKRVKGHQYVSGLLWLIVAVTAQADLSDINMDELECILEPNKEIEISAAVSGVLSEVLVQRGEKVNRGQLLARLVSGPERAAVELAQARVEFGKRKSVRNEDLYQKELISIHEKDELDTELLISELQLKQARENLKQRSIMSPINGIVVERDKDPGEYVETEPLLTVVSLDPLNVEVVAPAEIFGSIKKGMTGKVTTLGGSNKTYQAKVILIDQVIDAASGTIRIRLALNNPRSRIPAGLRCRIDFN
ncbi:MAG: efflux RND transporter periplasmic adaptor subunit [Gammaproteobacteria bacterium]|nr:efflux RND transporter periplasmic adaptor subunit [Gammaproteobacteria bacterium]